MSTLTSSTLIFPTILYSTLPTTLLDSSLFHSPQDKEKKIKPQKVWFTVVQVGDYYHFSINFLPRKK